jgi:sodium transport system ATP-binding protein
MGMPEATIEIRDLVKVYHERARGEVRAVDGITFSCRSGEIFGLLGPNGAGKTTTLRTVSTVLEPTEGSVRVMGRDTRSDPVAVRRSIGFYSSTTALFPRLTPRETLTFFAEVNGYSGDLSHRVEALIGEFDLEGYADVRVERLSQGMKQKVSLARTVVHEPPVLVLDEPTTGLDVLNAREIRERISRLRDIGKTVLFSTHIMAEAEKLCDRIAVIHEGRLLGLGTLEELRETTGQRYLEDAFVELLLESRADG